MDIILNFLGALIIWIAVDIGRNQESKIKPFSKDWFLALFAIALALSIIDIK